MIKTNKQEKIEKQAKIAIIGGGVAGSSVALYFAKLGLDITLFEKEKSLVNGPPFCHLHAGGNLYREISDFQCVTLLKQSIDFLRFYPYIVDYRPTVIALPIGDNSTPEALLPRLKLLREKYKELIAKDAKNEVLGEVKNYYKTYSKEEIEELKTKELVKNPKNCDEWMIPVAKNINLSKIQFPLIMVQEYGLNLFRLSSGISLALESLDSVKLHIGSIVHNVQKNLDGWSVSFVENDKSYTKQFDYLINAAGFRSGKIDDFIGTPCKAMVEFKAAYVSRCDSFKDIKFPEIIFHGKRGTPQGMGQFTPYPNGYFQLHAMTKDITLYEDGLVSNTILSCQPKLGQDFIKKIEKSWTKEEIEERTKAAISHLSQFIPYFSSARVGSKPLFGAQQIPGDDPTLRVAEVSFPSKRYARCEIVKVSSVLDMIDAIAKNLASLGYISHKTIGTREFAYDLHLDDAKLSKRAKSIAIKRNYPDSLATRTTPKG